MLKILYLSAPLSAIDNRDSAKRKAGVHQIGNVTGKYYFDRKEKMEKTGQTGNSHALTDHKSS